MGESNPSGLGLVLGKKQLRSSNGMGFASHVLLQKGGGLGVMEREGGVRAQIDR